MTKPAGVQLGTGDRLEQARSQWTVADTIENDAPDERTEPDDDCVVEHERGCRQLPDLFQCLLIVGRVRRQQTQHYCL